VATILNYAYLLRERKLGEVNDRQVKAVRAIDAASNRLVEMVRHYLNLSRIENGELQPLKGKIALREDILNPLVERLEHELQAIEMRMDLQVGPEVRLMADRNMVLEVFENLFSNAMKYGRPQGVITLRAEAEARPRAAGAGIGRAGPMVVARGLAAPGARRGRPALARAAPQSLSQRRPGRGGRRPDRGPSAPGPAARPAAVCDRSATVTPPW